MNPLLIEKATLSDKDKDEIRSVMGSAGFKLIREAIGSAAASAIAEYANASAYVTDTANVVAAAHREDAIRFNVTLDVLDEVEQSVDTLFRISLGHAR